jgi:hypothetical protein
LLTDEAFADDLDIIGASRDIAENSFRCLVSTCHDFGMTVSIKKTKVMAVGVGISPEERGPVDMGEAGQVEAVSEFCYLGSIIEATGGCRKDVRRRLDKAGAAFGAIRSIVVDRRIPLMVRRSIFLACVRGVLLFGCEAWALHARDEHALDTFEMRCIRAMMHVSSVEQYHRSITNQQLRDSFGLPQSAADVARRRRLQWLGHVLRMGEHRLPRLTLLSRPEKARPRGGTKLRWKDRVKKDLCLLSGPDIATDEALHKRTADRAAWRQTLHRSADKWAADRRRSTAVFGPFRSGMRLSVKVPHSAGGHGWYTGTVGKDLGATVWVHWDNGDDAEQLALDQHEWRRPAAPKRLATRAAARPLPPPRPTSGARRRRSLSTSSI